MSDCYILAVISQKGGPGKTSFALNLASAAAERGYAAVIIDLDPQANAANWKDRRDKLNEKLKQPRFENPAVISAAPGRLRQTIEAAEQNAADFIVIDSPGKADNIAMLAATYADLVLVPVEPRMSNLETLEGVHGLIQAIDTKLRSERLRDHNAAAFVVLNKLHPSATTQAETLKRMIAEAYPQIPVCPHHISYLDSFGTSQDIGKSVFDDEPKGRAAEEIRQLYKFIIRGTKLETTHHVETRKSAKRA
jgi:chromosome partitioning protein